MKTDIKSLTIRPETHGDYKDIVSLVLRSCGDVRPFIPEFTDMGIDALNPIEVKAGMEPVEIKEKYGKNIVLHGGINALAKGIRTRYGFGAIFLPIFR